MTTITFEPMSRHPLTGSMLLKMYTNRWAEYYTFLRSTGLNAINYPLSQYQTLILYKVWKLKV